jgi:hypothetical protein
MPTRPEGEKRPADVIGNAVKVMHNATGEEADDLPDTRKGPGREGARSCGRPAATANISPI